MTQVITPSSAANLLRIKARAIFHTTATAVVQCAALFQDSAASALAAAFGVLSSSGTSIDSFEIDYRMMAGTVSATTFKLRAGPNTAATTTFNGNAGNRNFGGVANSYMSVEEIMA
jgi:hypothetical protein